MNFAFPIVQSFGLSFQTERRSPTTVPSPSSPAYEQLRKESGETARRSFRADFPDFASTSATNASPSFSGAAA